MILGMLGYAGAGKDASYQLLANKLPATRYAFADRLKQEVASAFGVTVDELEASKEQYRELLQAWGVARRRINGWNYWVDYVTQQITHQRPQIAVITDVRFQNEIYAVRDLGGILVRVDRAGVGPRNDHISEHDWASAVPDFILRNDGDLEDLSRQVDILVKFLEPLSTQRWELHSC